MAPYQTGTCESMIFLFPWWDMLVFMEGISLACNQSRMIWPILESIEDAEIQPTNGTHPGRLTWNLQITYLERKMI